MPSNHKEYQERLSALRQEINRQGLNGFWVPYADEYQGEFLPACARRLEWLTGFSGSAGEAAVLADKAVVMSDGRYTLQLPMQVDTALYECGDSIKTGVATWLAANAKSGDVIGYDPWLHTPAQIEKAKETLDQAGIVLKPCALNPLDAIWKDRPFAPLSAVKTFPEEVAGKSAREKCLELSATINQAGAKCAVLSASDSICWLLNVRGADVEYSPLILSYAILHEDGSVDWFIVPEKLKNFDKGMLEGFARFHAPQDLQSYLKSLSGPIALDYKNCPAWFLETCRNAGQEVVDLSDPCSLPRSLKTLQEQDGMRRAHIIDGVAMVKFLHWLDEQVNGNIGALDELSCAAKLEEFRQESPDYRGPSFATISGFGPNGAIVHYRADEKSNLTFKTGNLYLLDSGGQYAFGTTDITRTLPIGAPSEEMKRHFTLVLKGHIALAMAEFKEGTMGRKLDELARAPLRREGLDYAHGTGHGVGCYLCVHEAAANISPRGEKTVLPGMILSNEPGYYKTGAYGIRIENIVLANFGQKPDHIVFETLTLCPIDRRLVLSELLSTDERKWLNDYHKCVREELSPYLAPNEKAWLEKACAPF